MITIDRTVSLDQPITSETLRGNEFTGEQRAHVFRITVKQGGSVLPLTGTVTAKMLLANGDGLNLAGSLDSGVAVLPLVQACYGVPGRFHLAIYHTTTVDGNTDQTCIYSAVGSIVNATGDPEYDPGDVIGDLSDLIAAAVDASETADAASAAALDAAAHQYEILVDQHTLEITGPAAHSYDVAVTGATPSVTAENGVRYVCTASSVSSLAITLPDAGIVSVVFKSGTTPTALSFTGSPTIAWPAWFDPTSLSASVTYELNIAGDETNGYLGAVGVWS